MSEQILVINKNDEIIGLETKENCHLGDGILHRAITIFVFNNKNEILLCRRSALKKLWPDFWDTSCSTHIHQNETHEQAGKERLNYELGFSCELKFVSKFQYQTKFKNIGSENEICYLLIGNHTGDIRLNFDEVSEYKWASVDQLKKEINDVNNSPWLKIAFQKYLEYINNK